MREGTGHRFSRECMVVLNNCRRTMFACAFQAGAPSPSHLAETPCPIEESMLDACGGVFSLATPDSTRTPYALGKEWCSGAVLAQKVVLASSSIGCACAEVGHDTSFRTATLAPFLTCSTYSVVLHANNHNSLATLVIRNWTTLVWSCPLTISRDHIEYQGASFSLSPMEFAWTMVRFHRRARRHCCPNEARACDRSGLAVCPTRSIHTSVDQIHLDPWWGSDGGFSTDVRVHPLRPVFIPSL